MLQPKTMHCISNLTTVDQLQLMCVTGKVMRDRTSIQNLHCGQSEDKSLSRLLLLPLSSRPD